MSQLSDFLKEHQITDEALISASRALEKLSPDERDVRTKRKNARTAKKAYAELNLEKTKARGRGLTQDTLGRALAGQALPRLARQKIVRAVNTLLTSKKKDAIDWRPLFTDAKVKKGKSVKK